MPKAAKQRRAQERPLRRVRTLFPAPTTPRKRPLPPLPSDSSSTLVAVPVRRENPRWLMVVAMYFRLARLVRSRGEHGAIPEPVLLGELLARNVPVDKGRVFLNFLGTHGLLKSTTERAGARGEAVPVYRVPEADSGRYKPY